MTAREQNRENLLSRSAERYQLAGGHIARMLDRRLTGHLPQETYTAIESTMVVACYTDAALDSEAVTSPEDARTIYEETSDFLFSTSGVPKVPDTYQGCAADAWQLRSYLATHDEAGRQALQNDFYLYHALNKELREAREPRLYAALTRLEGKIAMRSILDLLPASARNDEQNAEQLRWFLYLGQLGNTYDSLADSATDVRTGRTRAGSPLQLRLALGKAAVQDLGPVVRGLSIKELLPEAKDFIGVLHGTTK